MFDIDYDHISNQVGSPPSGENKIDEIIANQQESGLLAKQAVLIAKISLAVSVFSVLVAIVALLK